MQQSPAASSKINRSRVSEMKAVNPMLDEELQGNTKSSLFTEKKLSFIGAVFLVGLFAFMTVLTIAFEPPTRTEEVFPRTAFVHLFEWKWTDIEQECVNFLGPMGFKAVQVSPVNEHIDPLKTTAEGEIPWWARYQPVSYKIESRSGTREEFVSMVETCKSVGVGIYVDAVLNHMAAQDTQVGSAGTPFDVASLTFEDYDASHFNECDPPEIQGEDYQNNPERVRNCRLVGLPDLNQADPHVRGKMIAFLQDLVNIGVEGFRLDVAKHMFPEDLEFILDKVDGNFYVFGEVPSYGNEAVKFEDYTPVFPVTEFRYKQFLADVFKREDRRIAELFQIGAKFGFVRPQEAVVFVDNHDTQRSDDGRTKLIYKDGALYDLANVFLLAYPYGNPKIMSSFDFEDGNFNQGPPSNAQGVTNSVYNEDGSDNCFGEWVCEHRRPAMYNSLQFKNFCHARGAFTVSNWWTNNFQAIAFSREGPGGVVGFVIINAEDFAIEETWQTGLPDSDYCDVMSGDFVDGSCKGRKVRVRDEGELKTKVEAKSALVIYIGAEV